MTSNPVSVMAEATTARRHLQELYDQVKERIQNASLPDGVYADARHLGDCLDRFYEWARSLGVFQRGDASLDARLANREMIDEIIRLLRQLDKYTSSLRPIIRGTQEQQPWLNSAFNRALMLTEDEVADLQDSSDEDDVLTPQTPGGEGQTTIDDRQSIGAQMTESKDLHLCIDDSVTSLLRLSVIVSKASRRGKFSKPASGHKYDIVPDVNHVKDSFPFASANKRLLEKLGSANAQRRQWLNYRRRHRDKLSLDFSGPVEQRLPELMIPEQAATESIALFSATENDGAESVLSGTRATTFRTPGAASAATPSVTHETTFGLSSKASRSEPRIKVPEPPTNLVLGQPHFCRYCCNIVQLAGKNAWPAHVHSDISSYTCVFQKCGELFFDSRSKWWAHEMETHRQTWSCNICGSSHSALGSMMSHISQTHSLPASEVERNRDLYSTWGRPKSHINAADCPLCDYPAILRARGIPEEDISHVPAKTFGRHLGRHLEQIALFVLPSSDLVEEGGDSSQDGHSDAGHGQSDSGENEDANLADTDHISEVELLQNLLEIAAEQERDPGLFTKPPDLAMRWQPPQDFTPPLDDFQTEDIDLLPARQDPIFGGDLFTPGWARGPGPKKEGFCARCPVSHWVNIPDGSYRFHLTYFHGVPDSGVPLPRPPIIRPVSEGPNGSRWEGYCEACDQWRILKKTRRGWNWYRHWLTDHKSLVEARTNEIRKGLDTSEVQMQPEVPSRPVLLTGPELPSTEALSGNDALAWIRSHAKELQDDNYAKNLIQTLVELGYPDWVELIVDHILDSRPRIRVTALIDTAACNDALLTRAAHLGHGKVVNKLLNAGANVNVESPSGQTPLDAAADAGYFDIAARLANAGCLASNSFVFKKILSNKQEYAGEMTTVMPRAAPHDEINPATLPALARAVYLGDKEAILDLLGRDSDGPSRCDVEDGAESGHSPLLLGSISGSLDIVDLLLDRGANINATSKLGWTPLMLAAKRADERCVEYLLSRGADVNHLSPERWTALTEAASQGLLSIIRLLLESGADPDIKAQSDWTALMCAAYRGDLEAVKLLLEYGASIEDISARDETVMLLAAATGSAEVVALLLRRGCPPESAWSRVPAQADAPEEGDPSISKADVSKTKQGRIERDFKVGWTPLMVACQVGSLDIVQMLVNAGANTQTRSPMLKTALEIARENGETTIVNFLAGQTTEISGGGG